LSGKSLFGLQFLLFLHISLDPQFHRDQSREKAQMELVEFISLNAKPGAGESQYPTASDWVAWRPRRKAGAS
jgi:hypothetical protein